MKTHFSFIKKILGSQATKAIRPLGHGLKSRVAASLYGRPSKNLLVIGITGTKGKTSTSLILFRLLNQLGIKTGLACSAALSTDGETEQKNPYKMSTPDGFILQKMLREMVENGLECVVLEMTSQGLEQNRHWGLGKFDGTIFLNLYPEHLDAHGGMENYKKAKGRLFSQIKAGGFMIYNTSSDQQEYSNFMLSIAEKATGNNVNTYGIKPLESNIKPNSDKPWLLDFEYEDMKLSSSFMADFEVINLTFAIKAMQLIALKLDRNIEFFDVKKAVAKIPSQIPGRMQWAVLDGEVVGDKSLGRVEGKGKTSHLDQKPLNLPKDETDGSASLSSTEKDKISILVDYAHEPASIDLLLKNLIRLKNLGMFEKIIHVISSDGAGRDDWKKPIMGDLSMEIADFTVVTTDNYDASDNPQQIVKSISQNFTTKYPEKAFSSSIDRLEAFKIALSQAQSYGAKTVIVSTGVGSEYGLTSPDGIKDWDEVTVWQQVFVGAEM